MNENIIKALATLRDEIMKEFTTDPYLETLEPEERIAFNTALYGCIERIEDKIKYYQKTISKEKK